MTEEKKLTPRQKRFVEAYLQTWNASEAARRAGYTGAVDVTGAKLLVKASIQNQVKARMEELSLQTHEVMYRFTEQARLNPSEFFTFDAAGEMTGINWEVFRAKGYLVKALRYDRKGRPVLEFHDSQTALSQIGKAHGMFVERVDSTQHVDTTEVKIYIPDNGRGDTGDD
jgi:phage terminase small subunit